MGHPTIAYPGYAMVCYGRAGRREQLSSERRPVCAGAPGGALGRSRGAQVQVCTVQVEECRGGGVEEEEWKRCRGNAVEVHKLGEVHGR